MHTGAQAESSSASAGEVPDETPALLVTPLAATEGGLTQESAASELILTESVCIHLKRQMMHLSSGKDLSTTELQRGCNALADLAEANAKEKIRMIAASQLSKAVYKLRNHANSELAGAAQLVISKWKPLLKHASTVSPSSAAADNPISSALSGRIKAKSTSVAALSPRPAASALPADAEVADAAAEPCATTAVVADADKQDAETAKRKPVPGLEQRQVAAKLRRINGGKPQVGRLLSDPTTPKAAPPKKPPAAPPKPARAAPPRASAAPPARAAPPRASAAPPKPAPPTDTITEAFGKIASDSEHQQLNKMKGDFVGRTVLMKWGDGIGWQLGVIEAFKDKSYYVEYGRRAATLSTATDLVRRHCGRLPLAKDVGVHDKFPMKTIGKKKIDKVGSWALLRL